MIRMFAPGLLQPRPSLCCAACALKDYRMDDWFLQHLLSNHVTVEDVTCMDDCELEKVSEDKQLTRSQIKAVKSICKSLIDCKGVKAATLVHRRYYQKDAFEVTSPLTFRQLNFSRFRGGDILEVMTDEKLKWIGKNLVRQFREECLGIRTERSVYRNLNCVEYYSCVTLSVRRLTITFERPSWTMRHKTKYAITLPFSSEDLFAHLQRILIKFESVSLVIVEDIPVKLATGEVEFCSVNEWLRLLSDAFGGLQDFVTVFLVDYNYYTKLGVINRSDVAQMVNNGMSNSYAGSVMRVDCTRVGVRGDLEVEMVNLYGPPQ